METGQVRIGFRHFAFLGPESQWAAEGSECAADQDAFWDYSNWLFAAGAEGKREALSKDNLKALAAELGLDQAEFDACLDSGQKASVVQGETQLARALGIPSTPTFLINGQPIVGGYPFEVFQQVIEAELKRLESAGGSGDQG